MNWIKQGFFVAVMGVMLMASSALASSKVSMTQALQDEGVTIVNLGDMTDIIIPADKLFLPNQSRLKYSGQELLNKTLALLETYGDVGIVVNAHTDEIGRERDRLALSKLQAQSVVTYFWTNGKNLEKMRFYGMDTEQPVADLDTVPGGYFNRRVDIMFARAPA